MRLERMGSFHQTRLSFMRSLLRRMKLEQWRFTRTLWDMDEYGYGRAVYTVRGTERAYSLVAFSHYLADENRSDRVIATAWDATFTLYDGVPSEDDLVRLEQNVPLQEAGRISDSELSLSRANKSVRLWQYVVEKLAAGEQPDHQLVAQTGYLMRTTAVYGSGKFGAADRLSVCTRPEMSGPFQAELLSVWLTRLFSVELVEHVAKAMRPDTAVAIEPALREKIGVGNSTGLGMAPFLVNHPALINNWMMAREQAIARVRAQDSASSEQVRTFIFHFDRARENLANWQSAHPVQQEKLAALEQDFDKMAAYIATESLESDHPWDRFYRWSESKLSVEGQEQLAALILEPYGELVDDLTADMNADEQKTWFIDGAMPVESLLTIIETHCQWAIGVDYSDPENSARFWYISAEKLEPRLGERYQEAGAEYEQPLCIGLHIKQLYIELGRADPTASIAEFLLWHPEHRHTVRRLQRLETCQYAEIRDNLIAENMLPIDLLRCKLSFFGATRFDPRSDRWVRICMYQDAPHPPEWLQTISAEGKHIL